MPKYFWSNRPNYWGLSIPKLEAHYKSRYLCDSPLRDRRGNWSEAPMAIFYNPIKHPTGSNYFGLYFQGPDRDALYITDGISATVDPIDVMISREGEIIYSTYRHDFNTSRDGSVSIDGGRDYTRIAYSDTEGLMSGKAKITPAGIVLMSTREFRPTSHLESEEKLRRLLNERI